MKRQEMKSVTEKGCLHPHIKMFNKKRKKIFLWILTFDTSQYRRRYEDKEICCKPNRRRSYEW